MFDEEALLPLSALQHLVFCDRQCALIHIEQVWVENRLTAEGRLLHQRADSDEPESRGDLRIARGLFIRSLRLGLTGRADVVEFHRTADSVALPGAPGLWRPLPVEYKRGKPKPDRCDEVQLCAQALCLEEMLGIEIPHGALFYGKRRRRQEVALDADLRQLTEHTAVRLHELFAARRTPIAQWQPKCRRCSLLEVCLPDAPQQSAREYVAHMFDFASEEPSS